MKRFFLYKSSRVMACAAAAFSVAAVVCALAGSGYLLLFAVLAAAAALLPLCEVAVNILFWIIDRPDPLRDAMERIASDISRCIIRR